MQESPYGRDAVMIGEVMEGNPGKVYMETVIGGLRVIDMMTGGNYLEFVNNKIP